MEMQYPAPFLSKFNPNTLPSNIDWSMTNPLHADGSDYPCKGYNHVLGTPEGAVTATFAQGGAYNFTIVGTAFHGGGSCQASLSYDGGRTFTVIQSIIGNCPVFGSGNFDFTVPSDAPAGNAVFAWTWFNNIGNREMYQNCAAVTITGGGHRKRRLDIVQPAKLAKRFTPFSARPANFIANVGNGCSTEPNKDVMFPDPGPDVLLNSNNVADVVGVCKPIGGAPTSSSPSATPTSSATSSAEPTTTTAEPTTTHEPTTTPEPTTTQQPSTTPEPSSSTSSSSELHSSSTEAPPSSSSSVAPTSSSQAEPSSVSTSSTTHTEPTSTSAPSEAPSTTPSTTPSPTSTSDSSTSPSAPTHSGFSSASSSSSIHATASPTSTAPATTSSPCAEATILRRGVAGPGKFLVRRRRAVSD
ncbi:hypothetical protein VHUM_01194 [Vanrija humicola]|uniref:Chitin-binding type-4 domain-containing protein n=1 Tax=Vanrija humicola TaxID=5417 RepID=A0A7D8Z5B5_VANHU|nr:hypothetical protein VHUM_01194 [Vanrija humicola]